MVAHLHTVVMKPKVLSLSEPSNLSVLSHLLSNHFWRDGHELYNPMNITSNGSWVCIGNRMSITVSMYLSTSMTDH